MNSYLENTTSEIEKSARLQLMNIISDREFVHILNKFGSAPFRNSSVRYGLDKFLSDLRASGKVCLEIGTSHGATAVVLSRFFDKVYSIDILPSPLKRELTKYLCIENIEFIDVKNNQEKAEFIKKLKFDFCFMDGNHEDDTEFDFNLVKHCGNVLFHEYWPHQKPVYDLFNSLKGFKRHNNVFAFWSAVK